jgi:hypothetical protein
MANLFLQEKMKNFNNKAKGKIRKAKVNLRFKSCILLSTFYFLLFTFSTSAQTLTLDSVLNKIEKDQPMLKMYDEQIHALNNTSQMAKSWMPPTISTGPWQTPYKSFGEGMWMVTGEQMIPNPAKQQANFNFMHGMTSEEQTGKSVKRNEMFAMAKQNYFEWIVLKKKVEVLVQTDSLLNYILKIAQLRYKYNKEKLNNIYKAQADIFELRNMETMFSGDIKMKNVELNTLMNRDKNFIFDIDTTIVQHTYELQLPDTALITSSRSDVKQFDASINLAKLQQQFERSKRLPDFGIAFTHMQSLGMGQNSYSAMGLITIPIVPWASGEYKYKIKGLDNTVNAINFQKQSLINETAGMIASLQTQIFSAKTQLKNYEENIIPAYYKSYQSSMIAYEQNTEDLFVVLDGLKMYRMAKMNEFEELRKLLKLQTAYEKEMEIR